MAYLKPPLFVRRLFNPLAMRFGIGGAATLVIPRRRTGHQQRIPVIPVDHGGTRYLVSTRGEADWVRNLRAAGGRGELWRGATREAIHATEVPVRERPAILATGAWPGRRWTSILDASRIPETTRSSVSSPPRHPEAGRSTVSRSAPRWIVIVSRDQLGEQLLPLLDRSNRMMVPNLKAIKELRQGPAVT